MKWDPDILAENNIITNIPRSSAASQFFYLVRADYKFSNCLVISVSFISISTETLFIPKIIKHNNFLN